MGFLMIFLYPGTALWLTGVRKGQASRWASSSSSSTLENTDGRLMILERQQGVFFLFLFYDITKW